MGRNQYRGRIGRSAGKYLWVVFAALSLAGCSSYAKVMKNPDHQVKYDAALRYCDAGKYQKTINLLENIAFFYRNSPKEDSIAYYTALSYYKSGDFETSSMLFDEFRKRYSKSPFLEDVEYMYAKGYYFASPQPDRDQTATRQAIMAIDEYLVRYPRSPKRDALLGNIDELEGKLHDKSYINAKIYYTTGEYKAAVVALRNATDQYPSSKHREELMYLTTKSAYLLAEHSVVDLQRERYLDMMDAYYNFVSEYPQSDYTKEVEKMHEGAKKYLARYNDKNNNENRESANGNQEI